MYQIKVSSRSEIFVQNQPYTALYKQEIEIKKETTQASGERLHFKRVSKDLLNGEGKSKWMSFRDIFKV
jgi:hypothetical protein